MLGNILVVLSMVSSLFTINRYYKVYKGNHNLIEQARIGYHAMTAMVIFASGFLLYIIVTHQYQYNYVFNYSNSELSTGLLISTFFAGQEGSFLLWLLFAVLIGVFLQSYTSKRGDLESRVMMIYTFATFFLILMIMPQLKSPFSYLWSSPNYLDAKYFNQSMLNMSFLKSFIFNDSESNRTMVLISEKLISVLEHNGIVFSQFLIKGKGLNPLLQNFWMQIHPPILFLGFALTAVPYSFAISALIKNKYNEWIKYALPWTLATSLVLGLGIMIGGYWAYGVLGWGGYWGWDPVENASLIPWIISIALIHTMLVQKQSQITEKLGRFAKTNLALASFTFMLVIYSTFLTRSGILSDASVHSFVDPGTLVYSLLLIYIITFSMIGIGGIYYRRKSLSNIDSEEQTFFSREVGLFYGSALLIASAIVIFVGTSSPIFGQSVEIEFYNQMNLPLVIIMELLIGVGLFFRWRITDKNDFLKEISLPTIISILVTTSILFLVDLKDILQKVLLFSNVFVVVINIQFMVKVIKNGIYYLGGHIAHIGIAIFLFGVLATSSFSSSQQVELEIGKTQKVLDYEMTFTGINPIENGKKYEFNVDVKGYEKSFTFSPIMYRSDFNNSLMREPHIFEGFFRDFYMSPNSYSEGSKKDKSGGSSIALRKGEKYEFENSIIEFTDFNIPEDAMLSMTSGKEFKIGAKIRISEGDSSYYVEPYMKVNKDIKEYSTEIVEETGLKITLTSLDVSGMINVNISSQEDDSQVEESSSEILTAEISIKPFMSLVWIGVIVVTIGLLFGVVRRTKDS
jgi:cytochrome c-type biogenesis protein CcmF